ncbi:MAG: response regulator transcription factor [Acidobacteriia bacterium]|nr:response regulator transcription factor [Terriglobia bacterium]
MSRILIVEDEPHLAQGLRFNLEAEGHAVEIVESGEGALRLLLEDKKTFDAVILDIMLPGKDGFTVARELRDAENFVPLLMLTARGRPEDVLKGFEAGADDYLPKPFNLDILQARIRSLLRRKEWLQAADNGENAKPREPDVFRFGDIVVDFGKLQINSGKRVFQLTMMEGDLLRYLIQNSGRPVSRKAMLENVWDLSEETETRAIDNFIVRLRRYIEKEPAKPRHLITVRGLGYRFVPAPD